MAAVGQAAVGQAAVGQLVAGRYRLVRPLASGGISRVWLATDGLLHRQVAVKRCALPDGLDAGEQDLLRSWTLEEARAFARVEHSNVIRIIDVVPDADLPWIVMEYVPSRSLLNVVEDSGPLPPDRVAAIGLAVLDALNAIARAGVLHLDVKPGNVLIARDGRVVLGDFGPVVTEQGVAALSKAGIILGSPNYIAPERLLDGVSTPQADLWSLGATLYFAVEGRPPYLRETTAATLRALADSGPEAPRRAGPLADVLAGLLQREPAARLSAAEAEERLREIVCRHSVASGEAHAAAVQPRAAGARPAGDGAVPPDRWRPVLGRRAVVCAAVAAVAAVLATTAAGAQRDGQGARWAGTSAALGQPAGPSTALPPGFTWWNLPGGLRVAAPTEWRSTPHSGDSLRLAAPGGGSSLQVSLWTPPPRDVVAALIAEERDAVPAGYRRIRIEAAPGLDGAVWEFTYRDPAAGPMRVLERVVLRGRHTYRIRWQAPRENWPAGLQTLGVVLDSFGPRPTA